MWARYPVAMIVTAEDTGRRKGKHSWLGNLQRHSRMRIGLCRLCLFQGKDEMASSPPPSQPRILSHRFNLLQVPGPFELIDSKCAKYRFGQIAFYLYFIIYNVDRGRETKREEIDTYTTVSPHGKFTTCRWGPGP